MSNWYEYMSEAELAAHMADEPQEAMVAMHPDGFPMKQLNERVWQTQGNVGNDFWFDPEGNEVVVGDFMGLALSSGLVELKTIGVQYWDRANLCVEYQQYKAHHDAWVDSGIRRAKVENGAVFICKFGPMGFWCEVELLSQVVEAAVAGVIEPPEPCHDPKTCEKHKHKKRNGEGYDPHPTHLWTVEQPGDVPTRVVNIDIQWLMTNVKWLHESGEWQWQSTSASTSAS